MCSYVADPVRSICVHKKMVSLGWLHTHEAQHCISQHWDFNVLTSNLWIHLSPTAEEDFQWWKSAHNVLREPQLPRQTRHSVVHGCIEHRLGSTLECIDSVRYMDNNRENTSHRRTRVRSLMGLTVLVASENSTVVSYINKQGGTWSIQLYGPRSYSSCVRPT